MIKAEGIFVSVVVSFVLLVSSGLSVAQETGVDESLRKGENRQTLEPAMFADAGVREAYAVARKIPWVLDSIYCYCRCKESPVFRHKSLLSCYVDDHASQ